MADADGAGSGFVEEIVVPEVNEFAMFRWSTFLRYPYDGLVVDVKGVGFRWQNFNIVLHPSDPCGFLRC